MAWRPNIRGIYGKSRLLASVGSYPVEATVFHVCAGVGGRDCRARRYAAPKWPSIAANGGGGGRPNRRLRGSCAARALQRGGAGRATRDARLRRASAGRCPAYRRTWSGKTADFVRKGRRGAPQGARPSAVARGNVAGPGGRGGGPGGGRLARLRGERAVWERSDPLARGASRLGGERPACERSEPSGSGAIRLRGERAVWEGSDPLARGASRLRGRGRALLASRRRALGRGAHDLPRQTAIWAASAGRFAAKTAICRPRSRPAVAAYRGPTRRYSRTSSRSSPRDRMAR
jgi:hypothetical protein